MLLFSMERNFTIRPARGAEDLGAIAMLMADYAASLPVDLAYQSFAAELAALPGKYAPPEGELFLALDKAGVPLGCVALRPLPLPDRRCEMKRLFLQPAARGLGLGRALMEQVVEAARAKGYRELCLDTLPTMASAIGLYEAAGFRRVGPYYAPTPPGTVFMGLAL
jgi:ribosomal protein S18 acetylase RimI-like enzyme